jgi:hypothetical protein
VLVALPAERAWRMWTAPQSELLDNPAWRPWPGLSNRLFSHLGLLSWLLGAGVVAAAVALSLQRRTRIAAAILVAVLITRTVVLAWSAFCLPRYLIPIYPVCFILIGAALGLVRWPRAASSAAADRA